MKLKLKLKKSSKVEISLPMAQNEADIVAKLIEGIASHMDFQNWQKLASDFNNPIKRKIALNYMKS